MPIRKEELIEIKLGIKLTSVMLNRKLAIEQELNAINIYLMLKSADL